jgi:hypothetical protein
MAIVQRRSELLAHAVRMVERRTADELIGGERHGLGKLLS